MAFPRFERQINNKTGAVIIGLLSVGLGLSIVSMNIHLETEKQTDVLKNIFTGVEAFLFAIAFMILGFKRMNKYVLESYGGFIGYIFLLMSSLPLFLNPITKLAGFYVIFVLSIIGWFLIVIICLKKANDKELVENALPQIKKLFTILVIVAIWFYSVYLIAINFPYQIPQA